MPYFQKTIATLIPVVMFLSPAYAQEAEYEEIEEAKKSDSGIYVSVSAAAAFFSDANFFGIQNPDAGVPGIPLEPAFIDVDFDTGYNVRGAIGYEFSEGFIPNFKPSLEVEFGYSEADVNSGTFNGGDQSFSGDTAVYTIQLNYNNDIILSPNQSVTPYIGGGIGVAVVDNNIAYFPNNGVVTSPTFGVFGNRTEFVSTSRVGLKTKLSNGFDIFLEGRYTQVSQSDFERRFIANGSDGFNANVESDTDIFALGIGMRSRF